MRTTRSIARLLAANWMGALGATLIVGAALVALSAPVVAPHDPFAINLLARLKPPAWVEGGSAEFVLGTDNVGRDVLSRIIYGARVSLAVGLGAVVVGAFVGTLVGLLAGFFGGWVDAVLSWVIDVQLSFPFTLLAIFLLATFGGGFLPVVLVLALATWVNYGRIVRGQVMSVRSQDYVEAARSVGVGTPRILRRYIIPNALSPIIVVASFSMAQAILAEAGLSFLGVGVDTATPSWGTMLNDGRDYLQDAWWIATMPGIAIALTVLGGNLFGDWLRDWLRPEARAMSEPLLEIEDLNVSFRIGDQTLDAVRGVSLTVGAGETVGIVGESGSGKSVAMLSIMRLLPPRARIAARRLAFDGRDLATMPDADIRDVRGRDIALVFQDPLAALNPVLTVGFQIGEVLRRHRGMARPEAREEAAALLARVGVTDPAARARQFPHQFSGGMRQRVMIAMALAGHPRLLIADEPTTALDVTVQAEIVALVKALQASEGMTMIWVTHDLGLLARVAKRVVVMYAGRIVEDAPIAQLYASPAHPYTTGLLASISRIDRPRAPLTRVIPGAPPDPLNRPAGCPFSPRCPLADAHCRTDEPPLVAAQDGRRVACWKPGQAGLPGEGRAA